MEMKANRSFSNGDVYCFELEDGYLIESTDTFLPFYTKDAIGRKQNNLTAYDLKDRSERWMIGVSCMSGCPVGCKFCATGNMDKYRNLTAKEMVDQVEYFIEKNKDFDPNKSKEFKINYTRMGEPFLNLDAVKEAIAIIDKKYDNVHHYISTIGLKGSDFSWIKDNITLQISLHSLDESKRDWLIPITNKMSIKELGQIRTKSNLKTTISLTLVDESDFDINELKKYFDPEYFFVKISPINPNDVSEANAMGPGIIVQENLL